MKNVKPIYIVQENEKNKNKSLSIPKIDIPNNINETKFQKYNNNPNYKSKIYTQNKIEDSNEEETNIKKNEILQRYNIQDTS